MLLDRPRVCKDKQKVGSVKRVRPPCVTSNSSFFDPLLFCVHPHACKVLDPNVLLVKDLVKRDGDVTPYLNLRVTLPNGAEGRILSPFGKGGVLKAEFPTGHGLPAEKKKKKGAAAEDDDEGGGGEEGGAVAVTLNFKKYIYRRGDRVLHQ
jgi:hypothetical protein